MLESRLTIHNSQFTVLSSLYTQEHCIMVDKTPTQKIAERTHKALQGHVAAEDLPPVEEIAEFLAPERPSSPTPQRRLERHVVPIAQLAIDLPPIDLYRLTGEDLRAFLAMHGADTTNEQRQALGFQL